ncbi:flagellar export chaperone FlgN [Phaeobacter sp. B1627]|uniref:flagellar export chaperone FlgN n=1 Tax=Phaeobacter sp. B1627 TaxID=2583809 RepID=UPI001119A192|nr:flagellar export chaperone FlgN [Phaeobacter sp. B1627]TNJ42260.1 flagellar biosynthesis protein FlgN [Phaeobacter sp. B1627]
MSTLTNQTPQALITALDAILDQERAALKEGQLHKLEGLLQQKEALFDQLNAIGNLEKAALDTVNNKVARNQELLGSAMKGIKAVANRMAELRKVRRGLEVYDRSGRKTQFSTTGSLKLEKRA